MSILVEETPKAEEPITETQEVQEEAVVEAVSYTHLTLPTNREV